MAQVTALAGLALITFYCIRIVMYAVALRSAGKEVSGGQQQAILAVSVVIPVRNEFGKLENLERSLQQQDYPASQYEVIFVDDHSEDGSAEFLAQLAERNQHYKLIRLDGKSTGKKQAIHAGIQQAGGSWIIQSDADCTWPSTFISGHARRAGEGDVQLIAGPVLNRNCSGLWCKLESLDVMSLTGTGMASFLRGRPILCSGANLSYSKRLYAELSQELLKVPAASGDDIFLLLGARRSGAGTAYLASGQYVVETESTGGPRAFLQQRVRWGSKSKHYNHLDLISLTLLVWLTNLSLTVFLFGVFFNGLFLPLFIAAWLLKSLADFLLLSRTAGLLGRSSLLRWFPLAAIFYYFYVTLAGLFSLAGKYHWKQRGYGRGQVRQGAEM